MGTRPDLQPGRRLSQNPRQARRSARRTGRSAWAGQVVMQAARSLHSSDVSHQLRSSHSSLAQTMRHFEPSDWMIVAAVVGAVLLALTLGVLGNRPSGRREPTAATPVPVLAPAAPSPLPAAAASPLPTHSPPATTSVVSAGGARARLRSGPSLQAEIVERVADGSSVTDLGAEASEGGRLWRQVATSGGQTGWMDASLLRPAAASSGSVPPSRAAPASRAPARN